MTDPGKIMITENNTEVSGRRIVFFGMGPLPEVDSAQAPGVANRLWNFLQPALAAGHECLVFSIENEALTISAGGGEIEPREWESHSWQRVRVTAEDCLAPERLAPLVHNFAPELCVGAGTLLAAWTACAVAGECPVWADLFGDPLAEIQAKAAMLAGDFSADEHIQVWRLEMDVLRRADRFSVVSRRQADALLGQLALTGRLSGNVIEQAGNEAMFGSRAMIHTIPCSLERMDFMDALPWPEGLDRETWLLHNGLPEDALIALWSGGFNAWVDVPTLVHGLAESLEREPRLYFVVTGAALPGYLEQVYASFLALASGSKMRERILALGWLPHEEALNWLRLADVGLMVDRLCAETRLGARNRLLYYAAARCPVVATEGSEVVEDMAGAGALAVMESGAPRALARTIHLLLNDAELRRGLGRLSYQYCEQHYLFADTARPFMAFVDQPRRTAAVGGGSEWINRYLDFAVRQVEQAELAKYRAGRLARLKSMLKGK